MQWLCVVWLTEPQMSPSTWSNCGCSFWGLPCKAGPTRHLRRAPSDCFAGPEDQVVLLVAIPDFSSTQTACLVNLRSLACQPISFAGFGADPDDLGDLGLGP